MVLVSIHPFALRKIVLVIVASLCFSALCVADPVLMVHRYAPAPKQFARATGAAPASLETASDFGSLQSVDALGNQTELPFAGPGRSGLEFTLPSSVIRNARCELRLTYFQAALAAQPSPFFPGEK